MSPLVSEEVKYSKVRQWVQNRTIYNLIDKIKKKPMLIIAQH